MKAADVLERIRLTTREPALSGGPRPAVVVLSEQGRETLAVAAGWRGAYGSLTTVFGVPIEIDDRVGGAWGVLDEHRAVVESGLIDRP